MSLVLPDLRETALAVEPVDAAILFQEERLWREPALGNAFAAQMYSRWMCDACRGPKRDGHARDPSVYNRAVHGLRNDRKLCHNVAHAHISCEERKGRSGLRSCCTAWMPRA
eukprot:1488029-Pleurochrysis_carterae.AAC.9